MNAKSLFQQEEGALTALRIVGFRRGAPGALPHKFDTNTQESFFIIPFRRRSKAFFRGSTDPPRFFVA